MWHDYYCSAFSLSLFLVHAPNTVENHRHQPERTKQRKATVIFKREKVISDSAHENVFVNCHIEVFSGAEFWLEFCVATQNNNKNSAVKCRVT